MLSMTAVDTLDKIASFASSESDQGETLVSMEYRNSMGATPQGCVRPASELLVEVLSTVAAAAAAVLADDSFLPSSS